MSDILAINKIELTAEDKTAAAFESVGSNFQVLKNTVSDFGATAQGVFAALGIGAFTALISGAIDSQAELARLAERTGATVESLSAMRTAAKYAGVEMEDVAKGLQKFAKNIAEAQTGAGKSVEVLTRLGFNAATMAQQFGTVDKAALAVAQRLNQYGDSIQKTADQQALFSKTGANLAVFLRELAERGLDNVKVTTEQAKAARDLENSLTKLRASFTTLVNQIASAVVPVLQKVIDSLDTFKAIGIAAVAAFVVWPAILSAATVAMLAYREAALGAALANEVLGASQTAVGNLIRGSLATTFASATALFGSFAALLTTLPALLFAAFAGWKLGEFLRAQFLDARLFGIAFVDSMLTGWENIKFGGQVAWEFIKFAFTNAVEQMKVTFGSFIEQVGKGLSYVPGLSDLGAQVAAFGQTLTSGAGSAVDAFKAKVALLSDENTRAKKEIHDLTDDMMVFEILQRNIASKDAKPKEVLPPAAVRDLKDLTGALNAYEKALAAVAKAGVDALAKRQTEAVKEAEADLERSYSRGVVAFAEYWDRKTALQTAALAIQEQQLKSEVAIQTDLVNKISAGVEALDPANFKKYSDYQKAWYKASTDLANAQAKLVQVNGELAVVQQKGTQVGKDYVEVLIAESNGSLESIKSLVQQIEKTAQANEQYGMTASQIQLVIAERNEERLAQALANGASAETIRFLEDEITARRELSVELKRGEDIQHMIGLVKSFDAEAKSAFENILSGGTDTFKKIGESLKKFVIDLLYELTVKKWIISIGASLTGVSAAGVANATASSGAAGDVSSLLSTGSSVSSIGSLGSLLGGTGLATSILGAGGAAALGGGFTAGLATLGIAAEAGTAAVGGLGVAVGALGAVAIPVVGWIAAIGIALWAAFGNKGGGPKAGGFASTDPTAQRFFTPNEKDADLAKVVEAQHQSYLSAIAALGGVNQKFNFGLGFDTDPQGTAPNRISSSVTDSSGNQIFGSRDRAVGRDDKVLQDELNSETAHMLLAALRASNLPAEVTKVFDDMGAEAMDGAHLNDLIAGVSAIHRGLSLLGGDGGLLFGVATSIEDIIKVAKDGEKISDVWTRVSQDFLFTNELMTILGKDTSAAFGAIGLASIDAREALIDAAGGMTKFAQGVDFLWNNFFTQSQRLAISAKQLDDSFANLGVTAPQTHQGFLDLLGSLNLLDPAQAALYASLMELKDLFIQVHGTADDASKGLQDLIAAMNQIPDTVGGGKNPAGNLSDEQLTTLATFDGGIAKFTADLQRHAQAFTTSTQTIAAANRLLDITFGQLGVSVPKTHEQFDELLSSFDRTTEDGAKAYAALIGVSDAFVTIHGTAQQAADALKKNQDLFDQNFYTEAERQAKDAAAAMEEINKASRDLGITIPTSIAGFRALVEAMPQLHDALIDLVPAIMSVNAAVKTLADTSVSMSTIFSAAQTTANAIISNIQNLANAGTGTYGDKQGQQASLLQSQADEFRRRVNAMMNANGFNEDAAVQQLETTAGLLQDEANKAVDHLARYTVLSAQYSSSIAEQLVALQDWNTQQQALFRGNADALAALAATTDARWKAIVQGTSTGVTGTIDQLQKLRDSIATYLTGLLVSDKSILTPQQKLDQAKGQYQTTLGLAQGGDQTALGAITGAADTYLTLARQFYASSAANTAIFNQITSELADLAIPPGTTATTTPTIALQNALPTKGKLASSEDIAANTAMLARVLDAVNANTAVTAAAMGDAADQISGATDAASTKTAVSIADAVTTTDRR